MYEGHGQADAEESLNWYSWIDWHSWLNSAILPVVLYVIKLMWNSRAAQLDKIERDIREVKTMMIEHLVWHAEHRGGDAT